MGSQGVSVITATGGRPRQFSICKKLIEKQTFRGPIQWIVVDDCVPTETNVSLARNIDIYHLRLSPNWRPGTNTLARNLLAAANLVIHDRIAFMEDDDWYHESYLELIVSALDDRDIVGYDPTIYYHLPCRKFRMMSNYGHASLCCTAIRSSMLNKLRQICEHGSPNIDVDLWTGPANRMIRSSLLHGPHVVGIKGLPGRPGIGIGHRPEEGGDWKRDEDLSVFRNFVRQDFDLYEEFVGDLING